MFFLDNIISGIIIYLALFFGQGRRSGSYAVIGNLVAIITAYFLGGEHTLIALGLYGYNAILTIIAVSTVFNSEHNRFTFLSGIISACLTVPTAAALSTLLVPYGLPALNHAFCFSYMGVLSSKKSIT